MSEQQKPKKDGRGKPKGSKDTVDVPIDFIMQLAAKGVKAITVKRKWVEQCEKFYGIEFVEPGKEKETVELADKKDSVVRDRVIVKEEEL